MSPLSPTQARLILVRHGQTAHNRERRVQGHLDAPLDEVGQGQARALAVHLHGLGVRPTTIHTSDLGRAAATAGALHGALGGTLTRTPALREIHLGDWEGQLYAELQRTQAEHFGRFWGGDPECSPPGGETPAQVGERAQTYLRAHWPDAGETLIVVSHGITLGALLSRLLGLDYQAAWQTRRLEHGNTAYSVLTVDALSGEVQDVVLPGTPHLDQFPE